MTAIGWLQILVFFALVVAVTQPLGVYMFRVFEGERQPLPRVFGPVERALLSARAASTRSNEQTWLEYTVALLVFSAVGVLVTYAHPAPAARPAAQPAEARRRRADARVQHGRQLHHQHQLAGVLGRVDDELPDPDGGLAWHNFMSAAAGIGVALALARGLTRRPGPDGAQHARQLLGRSDPRASSTCCCRCRSSSRSSWSRRA